MQLYNWLSHISISVLIFKNNIRNRILMLDIHSLRVCVKACIPNLSFAIECLGVIEKKLFLLFFNMISEL